MVETLIISAALSLVVMFLIHMHYSRYLKGYKEGYKKGHELGRKQINNYALKVNAALNERVAELQSDRNKRGE